VGRDTRNVNGCSRERLYAVYNGMIARCYNKKHPGYANWGGRGITVCDEWKHNYQAFKRWALYAGYDEKKHQKYQTLDRIDNDGNYCPENCRWVTQHEQNLNQRPHVYKKRHGYKYNWTFEGQTKSAEEWCQIFNVSVPMVMYRVKTMGMSPFNALITPVKRSKHTNKMGVTVEEVLELKERGMTGKQIAEFLGCSKNTVYRRIQESNMDLYLEGDNE
jgi:hypothetical protein